MNCFKMLVMCGACGLMAMGAPALAQATKEKTTQPAKAEPPKSIPGKADQPKTAQPSKEEMEMMEAWQKCSTPGEMHQHLAKSVGTWDGKVSWTMKPGDPPSESTCVTTVTMIMGGRFAKVETKGMMSMGGPPMPFEGMGIYGYNNATKKFEGTWLDNFGTMMMHSEGSMSSDGKTRTSMAKFTDPMTNKESWMKEVETLNGPDSMTLEMFGPDMNGKEFKMMSIAYTRKAGTDKAASTSTIAKPAEKPKSAGH